MAYAGKAGRSNRSANATMAGKLAERDGRGAARGGQARQGRVETGAGGAERASPGGMGATTARRRPTPPARMPEPSLDWQRLAVFAGGVTLGLAFGAGAALLFAPRSGAATRHAIVRRGRDLGGRAHDAWDDLRDDLRRVSRRGSRRLRRRVRDAWDARFHDEDDDC